MQNNHKDNTETKRETDTSTQAKPTLPPILSEKELRKVVKNFVMGWLTGTVKIAFTSAVDFARYDGHSGLPSVWGKKYLDKEIEAKKPFLEAVSIFLGRTSATDEERLKATNDLFDYLIILQSANRMKGKFMESLDIDSRISKVERDIHRIERIFEELTTLLRGAGILRS